MFERFHLETGKAPLGDDVPRIEVRRDHDRCVGCGICAKACVYGVHGREPALLDFTKMAEPLHARCVGCHRCVNECPKSALELRAHKDFASLGDSYYAPELIETLSYEAETGRVPVSGAGYRGPFAGPGFDGMWTDMSEIVRPTRDGIHGRETISTEVRLGRKTRALTFTRDGHVEGEMPPELRLGVPFVFLPPPFAAPLESRVALARLLAAVAAESGSVLLVDEDAAEGLEASPLGVRLVRPATADPGRYARFAWVELADAADAVLQIEAVRASRPEAIVSVRLAASAAAAARGVELARAGVGVLHLAATAHARWEGAPKRHLLDGLRELERGLVEAGLRDEVTVLASGGIARAEHAPKAILAGADAAGLDVALLIALGMRRFDGERGEWAVGQAALAGPELARSRARNLVNSWRDQLLEVMGAMGLREVARMQGEEGRSMLYADLEAEFLQLFAPTARKEVDPAYG